MKDNQPQCEDSADLRRRAEEMLREKADQPPQDLAAQSPAEIQEILHELRVHQIELEMQNEELQRTQLELKTTRERYFNLYDLAPVGYVTLSEQGLIEEANLTATGLLGVARGTLVKQPLSRFILKEDQDIYYLHRKQLFESGEARACDLRMLKKDGTPFWAHLAATAPQDREGTRLWRAVISDISQRKQTEEALSKSEQSFRALAENSGDYIMRYDHEHRHVYANPRAIQVSGRTSAEFIGKTHREMGFAEDLCALWERAINQVFATGQSYREIFKWESAEGAIYLDWRLFPEMDSQGRVIFVLGVSRDITERLEAEQVLAKSEEQFRTLASLAPVGIYLTKPDGTCLYTNAAWQNMAGLSAEEALGIGWVNGIHPDDREMVFANWQKMVESQGEWGLEYRFQNREGKTAIVFGVATGQKDASGNIVGYIGVNIDISERKRAELFSRNLVTMNPVSIQVLDTAGFTMEVNPAFKLLFGSVPPADHSIFKDPQLEQKGIGEIFDRLRNGEVVHFPDVNFNPHDSIPALPDAANWVRTIGFPICADNEKPERIVLMQENITERKHAELSLLESEARFKAVSEYSHNAICLIDESGKIIWSNEAFIKMSGYRKDQIFASTSFVEYLAPESIPFVVDNFTLFVKREPYEHHYNFYFVNADGQKRLCEKYMTDYEDKNGKRILALSMLDITDQKLAEEKINVQLEELRRWYNVTLGREGRIMELKREVNKLLAEGGKPPRYASVAEGSEASSQ